MTTRKLADQENAQDESYYQELFAEIAQAQRGKPESDTMAVQRGSTHVGLATSRVVWHGTATGSRGSKLRSILSKGLIDPKKECQKREDCEGVHFTSDVRTALYYAGQAAGYFGGNPVLVLARIDVTQAFLDTDGGGDLEALLDSIDELARDFYFDYLSGYGDHKEFPADFRELTSAMTKEAEIWLKQTLRKERIKSYPTSLFAPALAYVVSLTYLHFLDDVYNTSNPKIRRMAVPYTSPELKPKLRGNTHAVLKELIREKKTQSHLWLQIFLLNPRFTSTYNPEDSATLSVLDPVGYSGRSRIIGLVEFIPLDDEEQTLQKLCAEKSTRVKFPVAKIHSGKSTAPLVDAIKKWTLNMESANDDYVYVSSPWSPKKAGFKIGSIGPDGMVWATAERSDVCRALARLQ